MQIVSLTTDYGTKDYYVAELKAAILSINTQIHLLDISHDIDRFDIVQASFYLSNAMHSFPTGSIHVVGVNCNYKKKSEYICFQYAEQFFIGPNNGLFSLMFEDLDSSKVYTIAPPNKDNVQVKDIFAHAVGYISHGLPLEDIGATLVNFNKNLNIKPVITSNQIRATIIHIDHFENIVVNLKKDQFEKLRNGRPFELYYKQYDPITAMSNEYGDVSIGDPLAFFNSTGYLEIAINMDKASTMLNLFKNEMIQINFL